MLGCTGDDEMSLDFNNTCPIIDGKIEGAKEDINYYFKDMLDDIKKQLPKDVEIEIELTDYTDRLKNDILSYFEDLRSLNSDMRTQAERQINDLADEVATLETELEQAT